MTVLLNKVHHLISDICGTVYFCYCLTSYDLLSYYITYFTEGQPLEMINDVSLYVMKLLIPEKIVSQGTKRELKQFLGDVSPKFVNDLMQVR